jgi:hypothetical protein
MRVGKATAGGRKGIKKAAPVSGAVKFEGARLLFCKQGCSRIPARGRLP